jgi:energy-coupling factor transporter ATP-binding protein EcfA2
MGFTPQEIIDHIPAIEDFCELGEWFDRPIRTYSSGMNARLGFGVAINVEADILLIDEVLAVGDIGFQKKCIDALTKLRKNDTSLVFVSHSPYQIERVCDYAILLESGRLRETAESQKVVSTYLSMVVERQKRTAGAGESPENKREGTGDLRVTKVDVVDQSGQVTDTVSTGSTFTIRVYFHAYKQTNDPLFRIYFVDPQNTFVLVLSSSQGVPRGIALEGDGIINCRIENMPLMPKDYLLKVKVSGEGNLLVDVHHDAYNLSVTASPEILENTDNRGIAYAENAWELNSEPERI